MRSTTPEPTPQGWWAAPGVASRRVDVVAEAQRLVGEFAIAADLAPAGAQLVALRELVDRLEAVFLVAAADFDAAGGPAEDGAGSLAAWLRHRCRMAPGEAQAKARVAHAVASGSMAMTGEALRDGSISWRHADVVERTVRDAPAEHRKAAEQALQAPAKTLDPVLLKRVGAQLLHRLDVERAEALAVRRLERRGITFAETLDGMVAVSGLLDPVAGAAVMTAVDALTEPTRADGEEMRSWPQRRADALAEVCRQWLELGSTPQVAGQKPQVSVRLDLATLQKRPGCDGAELGWAGPVTAEEARMLACDAVVSRVLMSGPGQVLDVGRATRTIPPALRRAVVARDRTCVAPGCWAAPEHCDVHHIVFWEDGGDTSLKNSALLCRRHHGFVHLRGWTVVDRDDGTKTLAPPGASPPLGRPAPPGWPDPHGLPRPGVPPPQALPPPG